MKRNIIITLVIILGIIVLMFIGDVITIGEKLARVTHLWWVEYAFYGVILLAFLWLVIRPIVKLHRTPELPSLNHGG
jgi:membrane protein implicated in regulation of membrane protease activity